MPRKKSPSPELSAKRQRAALSARLSKASKEIRELISEFQRIGYSPGEIFQMIIDESRS